MANIKADGSVIIDSKINGSGFAAGVANLKNQFGKLAGVAGKLGAVLGGVFAVRGLSDFVREAIELGSDLAEVQNVVDVTFEDLNVTINEFAKNAITKFGLSELSAKQFTSTMGAMLKSMGFTTEQAAAMSMEIAGLAGDMASFYNLSGEEAFAKIRAGIAGETEPLKQLGINLSVANLEQFALTQGITKSYAAMTQQEQALLRYNYLLKVTADAQGDFARTSDSWANQTKILAEQFNSLKATIGQGLINTLTPVVKVLNIIISRLQSAAAAFKQFTALLFGNAGGESEDIASGYEDAAEGAKDLAGATEAAGKAAKKYLAGFDELQKIGDDASGAGSSIAGGGGSIDIDMPSFLPEVEDTISPKIEKIVNKIRELLDPLQGISFEKLTRSLSKLEGQFQRLGLVIGGALEWSWFNILVPFSKWTIEKGTPALIDLLTAGLNLLTSALRPVWNGIKQLYSYLKPVFSFMGDTVIFALNKCRDLFLKLAAVFQDKGPKITGIFRNIGEIFGAVWSILEPIIAIMREQFGDMFDFWGDVAAAGIGYVIDTLYQLTEFLAGVFTNDSTRAWNSVLSGFKNSIEYIEKLLIALFDFFGLEFDFSGISKGFKTAVNLVIGYLNRLIEGIVSGINTAIRSLNRFSVTIPSWIPKIGGNRWGFNIREIAAPQIPYLAKGAVIPPNAPFMAVLGDQRHGTNIEAPLSTIQEAVAAVMEDYAYANLAGHEATVAVLREILEAILGIEIGDDVIGQAVARYNQKMHVVRGGS